MSFRQFAAIGITICSLVACSPRPKEAASVAQVPAPRLANVEAVDQEADSIIRQDMAEQFVNPQRRKWRIEYRAVKGSADESTYKWHVAGTMWWVRLYPEMFSLDGQIMASLDRKAIHEIDAVALDQNYGVIDFYIYDYPMKIR